MPSIRRAALRLPFLLSAFAFVGCSDAASPEKIGTNSAAITTFPNDKAAFDYFRGKGLTSEQAAGIIGNLDVESGDDPTVDQEGGGPGRGLAQWLAGGRWDTTAGDNENDYAASQGLSTTSLQAQLGFIWYELNKFPDYGLARLKEATTVSAAVSAFEADFEGCGACDSSKRVSDGENVLEAYGSDTVGTSDPDAGTSGDDDDDDTSSACIVPSTGQSGMCMATSACDALGNHTSTPGYCPGADDIQCCTANTSGDDDSGITTVTTTLPDGGTVTTVTPGSGGSTAKKDGGAANEDDASSDSGGCAMSTSTNGQMQDCTWLLGVAAVGLARRRRRSR